MANVSIYRRFRPSTFDKVIGQDHIVRTLVNQIKSGKIGHAYLFTGTRGTGKTSCAKIFARAVNCLSPVNGSPCGKCAACVALEGGTSIDIIEIDAASNNGVDEIRELKENAQYRPTDCKYKVYIIDEVHMLTGAAFNALLKTLEEPPEHVIFILATTEVQKLPQTILSRCMRFDFRLVDIAELVKLLKEIFDELGIKYEETALRQMAIHGEGSVRDMLSIADMCMSYCGDFISYKDTLDVLSATNFETLDKLGGAILEGAVGEALTLADALLRKGRNTLAKDLANYFMNLIAVKNIANAKLDSLSENESILLNKKTEKYTNYRIARVMDIMAGMENAIRYSTQPKILLEANIVRACELSTELNIDALNNRVSELEQKLSEVMTKGITMPESKTAELPPLPNLLEEMAEVSEEELIFEEVEVVDDKSFLAQEAWAKVINKLGDMNENVLLMAASSVGNLSIINKEFIVESDDKATLSIFNRENNIVIMRSIIKEILGDNYNFVCRNAVQDKSTLSVNDKLTLDKLFSGEIKFKK